MLSSGRGSKDFNYLQLESDSVWQHSKAALFKDIETWARAALTMNTNAGEICTRMVHVLGCSQPVFQTLWTSLPLEWKLGPLPGQVTDTLFHVENIRTSGPTPRRLLPWAFLPWKRARKLKGKNLPQSDLLVCSLQLPLHIHNCT